MALEYECDNGECVFGSSSVMALLTVSTAVTNRIVVRLLCIYKDLWGEGGGKNVGTVVHRVLRYVCNTDCQSSFVLVIYSSLYS